MFEKGFQSRWVPDLLVPQEKLDGAAWSRSLSGLKWLQRQSACSRCHVPGAGVADIKPIILLKADKLVVKSIVWSLVSKLSPRADAFDL